MNDRLEEVKSAPRSVSQYQSYKQCPYRFYKERVERAWQRPVAWLPQGTAVHAAVEAFEKSGGTLSEEDTLQVYADTYEKDTNKYLEETPNLKCWSRSGPYDGEADLSRRYKLGREQVLDYLDWRKSHDLKIWTAPDGEPGIELEFRVQFGSVIVRGFVDQVLPELVRDLKTGNQPGDDFQLATYALALKKLYGIELTQGDYWMGAKNGKHRGPTHPYQLDVLTEEYITAEFEWLDRQIKEERFEPNPEPHMCQFCSVRDSCSFRMA